MKNIHTSHDSFAKHWCCVIANNKYQTYHEYESLQSGKFDKSYKNEFFRWAAHIGITGLETYMNLTKNEGKGAPHQGSRADCAL